MAKADVMAGGAGKSPRKAMAMGEAKDAGGNFGCESFEAMNGGMGMHPDHTAHTGMKGATADRGIGEPIAHTKHSHPAQAAPNHGPNHVDGYGNHHGRG